MDPHSLPATNRRIATALIDELVGSGDRLAGSRALRAAGVQDAELLQGEWLPLESLSAMFRAAAVDSRLPQRVGRALMGSPAAGLFLRYGGFATPEKAYRRCDKIMARETPGSHYEIKELARGHARVLFHPAEGERPEPIYCVVRTGMLEAIPSVYGLLPARVREVECAGRGAASCVYEVRWSRGPQRGLLVGAIGGVMLTAGLASLAGMSIWQVAIVTLTAGLICAMAGRSVDLARQLEAVAGARRGQLALLDQADRSIAEKIDQFARLQDAESADGEPRASGGVGGVSAGGPPSAASATCDFELVDLRSLVRRAVDSQQLDCESGAALQVELPDEAMMLDCEPLQLEMAIVALLRNAAEAAVATIRVSLEAAGGSLELRIEDDGPGIEEETVDEVFDPFVSEPGARRSRGNGLAAAYRVVMQHAGELRLESAEAQGTRVTVLLPRPRVL